MTQGLPTFKTVLLEVEGTVATLTLNRPDALNAIDVAMARDLQQAAQWLETRKAIRVVRLRAAGKAFCAGGDISMFTGDPAQVRSTLQDLFTPLNDFISRIGRMDKVWSGWRRRMAWRPAPGYRWCWPATSPSPTRAPVT